MLDRTGSATRWRWSRMDDDDRRGDFTVWGADISRQAIDIARRGRYGPRAIAGVPEPHRSRFVRTPPDRRRAELRDRHEQLRRRVRFSSANLIVRAARDAETTTSSSVTTSSSYLSQIVASQGRRGASPPVPRSAATCCSGPARAFGRTPGCARADHGQRRPHVPAQSVGAHRGQAMKHLETSAVSMRSATSCGPALPKIKSRRLTPSNAIAPTSRRRTRRVASDARAQGRGVDGRPGDAGFRSTRRRNCSSRRSIGAAP